MAAQQYVKRPALQEEWERIGTPGDTAFLERLAEASLETMIAARRVHAPASPYLRDRIDEILVAPLTVRVRALAARLGLQLPANVRDEIEDELNVAFWEAISKGESFFEIAFNLALHDLGISIWRRLVRGGQSTHDRVALRFGQIRTDAQGNERAVPEPADPAGPFEEDVERRATMHAALALLPAEERKAFIIHHVMGLPIYSSDSKQPTVATVRRWQERKARQLVADATRRLRAMEHELFSEEH
jgi:DNA-directed RNA polymerase specialized sigma24 family protein